jgi:hypothetical protein
MSNEWKLGGTIATSAELREMRKGLGFSTPRVIHVSSDGHDTLGNGTLSAPYLTAQVAYDAGIAAAVPFGLQFGYGTYNIQLSAQLSPALCLFVRGAGSNGQIGGLPRFTSLTITATPVGSPTNTSGNPSNDVYLNAFDLNLTVNANGQSVTVDDGGSYAAGNGGTVTIFGNAVLEVLNVAGGGDAASTNGTLNGANAGIITLSGCLSFSKDGSGFSIAGGIGFGGGGNGGDGALTADNCDMRLANPPSLGSGGYITLGRCSYNSAFITPASDRGGNASW